MEKRNVPKLRFKGFEDEWKKDILSDLVDRVVRKNKDNVTKRPLTISAQYGLIDQEEFFNKIVASKNLEGYYLLNKGEFAYNKSYSTGYPIGAIKRLDKYENGAVSTLYICFKNKKNMNSDFLVQYFESDKWHKEISMIAVEGARNHGLLNISVSDFFDTIHSVPSLEEQTKIANFLSRVDKIIEEQDLKVKDLELYKKGMMQKIFKQEIRFKDDNGENYPKWEEKSLSELGDFYRGYSYTSNDTSTTGLLVLRSNNIDNNKINYDSLQFVNGMCKEELKLKNKDILICMSNGSKNLVGKSAEFIYSKDSYKDITVGAFCSIYRSKNVLSKYLLQTQNYKNYLSILLAGTNINNLKNSDLEKLTFYIPNNIEEQTKIANFLSNIDKIIEEENKKLEDLRLWKKGLLQQMFV